MLDYRHCCFSLADIRDFLCVLSEIPELPFLSAYATYGAGCVSTSHGKLARRKN